MSSIFYLIVFFLTLSLVSQDTPTNRERSDHFGLCVKLQPVITCFITRR